METKKISFVDTTQVVLNIFLIVSGLSVMFYLAGDLNYKAYYSTLGINGRFLDFSYSEYIENGFLSGIFILLYLPFTIERYSLLYKIKQAKENISFLLRESDSRKDFKKYNSVIKEQQKGVEELEKNFIDDGFWMGQLKFIFLLLLFFLILILIVWWFHNYKWLFIFILIICQYLVTLCYFYTIKLFEKIRYSIYEFAAICSVFIIIYIFVFPILGGYVVALEKLKTKDFDSYIVFTDKRKINSAKFVLFGKDNYFFFVNDKLTIIPQSQIKLIEKN